MAVRARDNFNRANENPMAGNWTTVGGGASWVPFQIVSNQAVSTAPTTADAASYYNAVAWPADHWSQVTITNETGTTPGLGAGLTGRYSAANGDLYRLTVNVGVSQWDLHKWISPTYTLIWARVATWVNGDPIRLEIQGTTIRVYNNNVQVGADATDSGLSTGSPGIALCTHPTDAATFDDWSGGDFSAEPIVDLSFSANQSARVASLY